MLAHLTSTTTRRQQYIPVRSTAAILALICYIPASHAGAGNIIKSMGGLAKDIIKGVIINLAADKITDAKPANPSISTPTQSDPINQAAWSFVRHHFNLDSACQVDAIIPFYAEEVFYEKTLVDLNYIHRVKKKHCQKYSPGDSKYMIRPASVYVSRIRENSNVRIFDYIIDWDVFSLEKGERLRGATSVKTVIEIRGNEFKILGESHQKIS